MFCGARCIARGDAKSVKKKLNGCGKTTKVSTLAKRVCNMSSGLCGDRRVRSSSVLVLVLVCFWSWSGSELCCAVMPRAMRVCKISKVSYLLPRHLSQTMARSLMMTGQDKPASIIEGPPHMSFIKAFMTTSHSRPRTMLKRYGICDSIQIADFYFHSRCVFFSFFICIPYIYRVEGYYHFVLTVEHM